MLSHFLEFLMSGKLSLTSFELKIGTSVTPAMGNVPRQSWFFYGFLFSSLAPVKDRWMERQADEETSNVTY